MPQVPQQQVKTDFFFFGVIEPRQDVTIVIVDFSIKVGAEAYNRRSPGQYGQWL